MQRNPYSSSIALRRLVVATSLGVAILVVGACQDPNLADRSRPAQARTTESEPPLSQSPFGVLPVEPRTLAPSPLAPGLAPGEIPGTTGQKAGPPPSWTGPPPGSPTVTLTPPPVPEGATPIGLLLPLSGRHAALGQAMLRAAQIAVFDIAADDFLLMPYDTAGTADGARRAAEAAVTHGARLVLGPLFAASVRAAAPVARAAGVNLIAFSNDRTVAGDGAYLIGLLPREQIRRVVSYAASRGTKRFAALIPDSAYGKRVAEDLEEAALSVGGLLVRVETYALDGSDLSLAVKALGDYDGRRRALLRERAALGAGTAALKRLEGLDSLGEVEFDALMVPVGGSRLKEIAARLPFYDIDTRTVRLLGMASWREPNLGREPTLVGAWYAAPESDAYTDFVDRYRAIFDQSPPALAPIAYDAAALAAVLARARDGGPDGPDFGDDAITSPNGFAGTAGIFRFLPSGEVQRGLAVIEIEPWRTRVVSPSPETFEDLAN